jgi:hypothetical protein
MIFIVHAIAKICYDLYFYKVSKNWIGIGIISICLVTGALISVTRNMPESPRYLFSKGKVEEAKKSFEKMCLVNKGVLDIRESEYRMGGPI